jgi:Tfp pilus assembly protein PilF
MKHTPTRRGSLRSATTTGTPRPTVPVSRGAPSVRPVWLVVALIAINLAVFAPVRTFDFVSYDDPWYVTQNLNVVGGLSWHALWWALTAGYLFYWHPVTWLSHMVDAQMFGLHAGGHHVTNLLLHMGSTLALFGFLRRATGAVGRSAVVAALFAVHPLHVESVAWIAERKDVLSALALMLTFWAYVVYAQTPTTRRYLVVLSSFAVGLMAKPMLVTVPVVLLLLDIWPLHRLAVQSERHGTTTAGSESQRGIVTSLLLEKLPLFVLAVAVSVATFLVQVQVGAVGSLIQLSLGFRLANALLSYVKYIQLMLWPAGLAVFYPYPPMLPPWWQVIAAAAVLVAVSVAVVRAANRRPYLSVGWFWYLVMLLPVIGLFQSGDQLMADRFTYVPLVGLFLVVAWGGADLLAGWPRLRPAVVVAAVLAVGGCAAASRVQVEYWRNSETLWRRALAVTTLNHRAHAALGGLLAEQGKTDEAIAEYRAALRIVPGQAEWRNNLGLLYTRQGKVVEAMGQYAIAARMRPDFADAHNNLGAMLARAGRTNEAITEYTAALRINPSYALAHQNLALALAGAGRLDEALRECLAALALDPSNADWHYQAASLFHRLGNSRAARAHLEDALRLNPQHDAARRALDEIARQGG